MIDYRININGNKLEPINRSIFVKNMEIGSQKTQGGIYIQPDSIDQDGWIRPRWGQVYKKSKLIDFLEVGDWILMRHGVWTTIIKIYDNDKEIDITYLPEKSVYEGIMVISKEMPEYLKNFNFN